MNKNPIGLFSYVSVNKKCGPHVHAQNLSKILVVYQCYVIFFNIVKSTHLKMSASFHTFFIFIVI